MVVKDLNKLKSKLVQLTGLNTLIKCESPSIERITDYCELRDEILEMLNANPEFLDLMLLLVKSGMIDVGLGDLNDDTDGFVGFEAIDFYETNTGFTLQAGEIVVSGPGVHNKIPKAITKWFDDYSIVKNVA